MTILLMAAFEPELASLRPHLAGRAGLRWALTGMGLDRATAVARRELPGSSLVISTGCCGGLRMETPAGCLVIPGVVLLEEGTAARPAPAPDVAWRDAAREAARRLGLAVDEGPLLSAPLPLLGAAAKRACAERSGASAVDMETAAIAAVAAELALPYLAVRVVLDGVDDKVSLLAILRALPRLGDLPGRCLAELLRSAPPR